MIKATQPVNVKLANWDSVHNFYYAFKYFIVLHVYEN